MPNCSALNWCSAYLFFKIFLISVLLQFSLGFENIEDVTGASETPFYQYLQGGAGNIVMKFPRGYMVPIPRVGRRQIHEKKRQNMIPQPRIGRQLDINDELAEILLEIQNLLLNGEYRITADSDIALKKNPLGIKEDIVSKYPSNHPRGSLNYFNKDLSSSNEGSSEKSHLEDDSSSDLQQSTDDQKIGFDLFDDDRSQELIPLSRLDRAKLLSALDDKKLAGGLMTYPRLGRRIWELTKTLIPYPRAGRVILEPEPLDYDVLVNLDYLSPGLDNSLTDAFLIDQPVVQKRRNVKLIPRIGRKKRSIPEAGNEIQHDTNNDVDDDDDGDSSKETPESDGETPSWKNFERFDNDYNFAADKKSMRSKSLFSPRIGKKRFDYIENYLEDKRAAAFTPRIGRAALIPRIGRTDPRFRLKSRAFIPRIGRRAALIPRIGRSENSQSHNEDTN